MLTPDHTCGREMNWLCRMVACFGGNGGGDRRVVFAVGVSGEAVIVGMQCYGCHAWVCFFFCRKTS